MPRNKILSSKIIGTTTTAISKKIFLAVATKTQKWKRPERAIKAVAAGFAKAVQEAYTHNGGSGGPSLPKNARVLVMR
ncbi:MAG: hypothetical protein M1834_007069 [Cirrosporium novae-zelandiae]|nr:MAG: hypothetical protein M1834_007069 [Cirrosporium novae-zelandiae]